MKKSVENLKRKKFKLEKTIEAASAVKFPVKDESISSIAGAGPSLPLTDPSYFHRLPSAVVPEALGVWDFLTMFRYVFIKLRCGDAK